VVISKETMDAAGVKSKMIKDNRMIIPEDRIEKAILFIRGQKVMLDAKLAWLYGVSVERLNEAVRRNINRFPADFMFQLTKKEFEELKNQIGWVNLKSQGEKTFFWAYLFENQYVDQLRPGSRIMVKEEVKITGGLKHPNITLSLTKGENHDIFSFKEGEI